MTTQELRQLLQVTDRYVYLNTGQAGPSPKTVIDRIKETLVQEASLGCGSPEALAFSRHVVEGARGLIAKLVNARIDEVKLTHSTREGIATIFFGLDWQEGDELVICDLEHSSIARLAEVLTQRYGVRLVAPEISAQSQPEEILDKFESALGDKTRLVALSHIQFGGLRMPVQEIVRVAHTRGIMVLIDAAQSVGQISVDVKDMGCDFLAFPGQKWLMGPVGTGALFISDSAKGVLTPLFTTNLSKAQRTRSGPPLDRFDFASHNSGMIAGFAEAVSTVLEIGLDHIQARIMNLAQLLQETLRSNGATLLSSVNAESASGLVTIDVAGWSPNHLIEALFLQFSIIARTVNKPAGVRLCTAYFNTEDEMKYVGESLKSLNSLRP